MPMNWIKALVSAILLVVAVSGAHAQDAGFCAPLCDEGLALICAQSECECVRLPPGDNRWLTIIPSEKKGLSTRTPTSTGYQCSPELQQCGCYSLLDCFNMLLEIKVKCKSLDCDTSGCTCHFDAPAIS